MVNVYFADSENMVDINQGLEYCVALVYINGGGYFL